MAGPLFGSRIILSVQHLAQLAATLVAMLVLGAVLRAQVQPDQVVSIQLNTGIVEVVDSSGVVVNTVTVPAQSRSPDVAVSADGTSGIAVAFDGIGGGNVYFLDFTTTPISVAGTLALTVPGGLATFGQVTCGGDFAVITGYSSQDPPAPTVPIFVVDTASRSLVGQVDVPGDTYDVAVTPDGSRVLLAGAATQVLLDYELSPANTLSLLGSTALGYGPQSVAISPTGAVAAVAGGVVETFAITPSGVVSRGATADNGWDSVVFAADGRGLFAGASTGSETQPLTGQDVVGRFNLNSSGVPSGPVITGLCFSQSISWRSYNQIGISGDGATLAFHDGANLNLFDAQTLVRTASLLHNAAGGAAAGRCTPVSNRQLVYGTAPATTAIATQVWPAFTVEMRDRLGGLVTDTSDAVSVQLQQASAPLTGTTLRSFVNGVAVFDDLRYDTSETVFLRVTSSSGEADPIDGTRVLVLPRDSDLRIASSGITSVPEAPLAGVPCTLRARVDNVGQRAATAMVSFYDGDPSFGGALIGSLTGSIAPGVTGLFQQVWTPASTGLANIHVEVENLSPPEADPTDNQASRFILVGAPAESLTITVPDRVAWPGASSEVVVTIRNSGVAPVDLVGAAAGAPGWLTLLGDVAGRTLASNEVTSVAARLDVPLSATGAPLGGPPLVVPIPIQVGTAANGMFQGELDVQLFDQPAANTTIRVVDDTTGAPLPGALVSAQNLGGNAVTNGSGEAVLPLPPGTQGLFAYRSDYVATAVTVTIPQGTSTQEIRLAPGATLGLQEVVVSPPLSTQEIINRGVNVNDPVNNVVVDFFLIVASGTASPPVPLVLPNVEIPASPPPGTVVTFGGSASGASGSPASVSATFTYTPQGRTQQWLLTPGRLSALREFFDVTALVVNDAVAPNPQDVQIRNTAVTLSVPSGIGIPDLNGAPQPLTRSLGVLDAGEQATATWVIRGDEPGTYRVDATATGDLFAFGAQVAQVNSFAQSQPFEVFVPSFGCQFITNQLVVRDVEVDFEILVTNTGPRTAQLVRVEVGVIEGIGGLANLEISPNQPQAALVFDPTGTGILSAVVSLNDIPPGQSELAVFRVIPREGGRLRGQTVAATECPPDLRTLLAVEPVPPSITSNPQPQQVCAGSPVTFAVVAEGPELSYQWRKDGVDIPGETASTLQLPSVTVADAGVYDVAVGNVSAVVLSGTAALVVDEPVQIAVQPAGALVTLGQPFTLSVQASGTGPIAYQWIKDGIELPGATAASLLLPAVSSRDVGTYRCRVANPCGAIVSGDALVSVAASWVNYGTGLPGALGVPGLTLDGVPAVTSSGVAIVLGSSVPTSALAMLVLGSSRTQLPVLGGQLLVPVETAFTLSLPAAGLQVPLPLSTSVEGLRLNLQSLVLDPAATAGVAFSRGLELVIGR